MIPVLLLTAGVPLLCASGDSHRADAFPQLISVRYTERDGLPSGGVSRVCLHDGRIYALTSAGALALDSERWRAAPDVPALSTRVTDVPMDGLPKDAVTTSAVKTSRGETWVCTSKGAFRRVHGEYIPLIPPREAPPLHPVMQADASIRGVFPDTVGNVWLATDRGVCVTDGGSWWHPLDRHDGMPYDDVTCLAFAPNGDIWGGTPEGAWRLRSGEWRYFWGKRWLPANRVNGIAVDRDGSVWFATDGGVSRIYEQATTFEKKAAHYEEITAARHNRRGWVASSRLKTPGDLSGGVLYSSDDNDGLWTGMYVAAEAFRYAVTKDPDAKRTCKKSMNAVLDLVRLSGYPGFPARSIILDGEKVDGYDANETVRIDGATDRIWYRSPTNPGVICKGDTSSDELNGHYFAWYLYNDLVADEQDKAELRKVVSAVTDNLLRNEYSLVGHTGKPTRWGVFGPKSLNDAPEWSGERGLNSASILCFLKVAYHICGDKRYLDAYEDLVNNHHYLLNTLEYRRRYPWYAVNHSDDELAYLAYYPLMMLEKSPQRRAILTQTASQTWKEIRNERSPFYDFIYGAATGMPCDTDEAVQTLRDWPCDLIQWETRNSLRHDVTLRTSPHGRNQIELDRVLPVSERQVWRWNGNPWAPDGGNGGISEEDAMSWLLPYWMGRYHGFIGR